MYSYRNAARATSSVYTTGIYNKLLTFIDYLKSGTLDSGCQAGSWVKLIRLAVEFLLKMAIAHLSFSSDKQQKQKQLLISGKNARSAVQILWDTV
jgi:hypothetical protein